MVFVVIYVWLIKIILEIMIKDNCLATDGIRSMALGYLQRIYIVKDVLMLNV